MWDFLQYTSGEWGFSGLSHSSLKVAGAGVGAEVRARAQTSKTASRIYSKLSSKYLETSIAAAGDFGPRNLAGYLENSNSEGGKKSGGATKRCSQ